MKEDSKENDRYSKLELLLNIARAFLLARNSNGLSIKDIEKEFEISRRTVMRMKAVIDRVFVLEESPKNSFDKTKRWFLRPNSLLTRPVISAEEYAQLEEYKNILKNKGHSSAIATINNLINKLKIISKKQTSETDIEAILSSQGYAIRQAPKTKIPVETLEKITNAILAFTKIEFDYPNSKGELNHIKVEPYGIVYGSNANLLAHNIQDENKKYKYYTLSKIKNITILNDEYFEPDEDFSLKDYLANSFGIYQDENLLDVKLIFDKSTKDSVLNYNFHPSQKMRVLDNNDVEVTFRACGEREICWHLFTWGNKCKIIEPKTLKNTYKNLLNDALKTIE